MPKNYDGPIYLRLTPAIAEEVRVYHLHLQKASPPGVKVDRCDVLRNLIARGLAAPSTEVAT